MDLDTFVAEAIRTESKIDTVQVNELALTSTLQILIAMGNILDQMKKHIFYGKQYDMGAFAFHMNTTEEALQTLATLTQSELTSDEHTFAVNPRIFHAVVGIATESTELLEALDLHSDMDNVNLLEELGDIGWYSSIMSDELNIPLTTVYAAVIDKLKIRFPEKFDHQHANNRALDVERNNLESNLDNG